MLFLWVTFPKLLESFEVIKAWGFEYKTVAFVWIKQTVCKEKRIDGIERIGRMWLIPKKADKPADMRKKGVINYAGKNTCCR